MSIVNNREVQGEERAPGVLRKMIAIPETGAPNSSGGDLTLQPGARIPIHTHDVEEIIFVHTGQMEATLGDETRRIGPDQTIVAPPGIFHGLVNVGDTEGRILTFFPSPNPQSTYKD